METQTDLKPRLSVIVPAMLGYHTVLAALDSWDAQSCRQELEILVLCPTQPDAAEVQPSHTVVVTGDLPLHEARALGARRARGDYLVFAEDHCVPDPQWAQNILARLAGGWDAICPGLRPGRLGSQWAQASFLIGYSQWMAPVAGPAPVLPGHNAVLRTRKVLELGPALSRLLIVSAFVSREFRNRGLRFYQEDRANMRHFDPPLGSAAIRILYYNGLGFGAVRTASFPALLRVWYGFATPLIAARHFARVLKHYARAGRTVGLSPWCLAHAFVLASAWACGEAVGAAAGVPWVSPRVWVSEIKPVSRADV